MTAARKLQIAPRTTAPEGYHFVRAHYRRNPGKPTPRWIVVSQVHGQEYEFLRRRTPWTRDVSLAARFLKREAARELVERGFVPNDGWHKQERSGLVKFCALQNAGGIRRSIYLLKVS